MSDTPDEFRRRLNEPAWAKIPERIRESLANYYEHRWKPGSALTAFLSGQLQSIVMVDEDTYAALPDIWRLMHNYAWSGLWGRPQDVARWVSGKTESPKHWPKDAVSRLGRAAIG